MTVSCALLVVAYFTVPLHPDIERNELVARVIGFMVVLTVLAGLVFRQITLHIDRGHEHRVDGLVLSVLTLVLGFAVAFYLLDREVPEQFSGLETRTDALYFTMSTLTTVGYGDVLAVGQAARALVLVQMLFNVVVIATAASVLGARLRAVADERRARRELDQGG